MEDQVLDIIEDDQQKSSGNIKIAQDVVATIAGMAAADIEGIAGMSGGFTDGITQILGKKQATKGVKVDVSDVGTKIDLFIIVEYGFNIAEIATKAQEAVRTAVENMTGMTVAAVNINVQGISFPKEEEPAIVPEVEVVSE